MNKLGLRRAKLMVLVKAEVLSQVWICLGLKFSFIQDFAFFDSEDEVFFSGMRRSLGDQRCLSSASTEVLFKLANKSWR